MSNNRIILCLGAICLIFFGVICGLLLRPQHPSDRQSLTLNKIDTSYTPENTQLQPSIKPEITNSLSGLSIVELAAKLSPSVVKIECFNETKQLISSGTGFFIDDNGKIATNFHVIRQAHSAEIILADGSREKINGIWTLRRSIDLAVLSTNVYQSKGLNLCTKTHAIPIGAKLIVMGSPKGLEGSLSDGILSAHRTGIEFNGKNQHLLQFTAPVSPGSSGSPVINLEDGSVIGIATMVRNEAQQLNFAVPTEILTELLYAKRESAVEYLTIIRPKIPYPFSEIPRLEMMEYFDYFVKNHSLQGHRMGQIFAPEEFIPTAQKDTTDWDLSELNKLRSLSLSFDSNPYFHLALAEKLFSTSVMHYSSTDEPILKSISEEKRQQISKHFERSIEIFPEGSHAWKALANFRQHLAVESSSITEHENIIETYHQCLKLDPSDWEAWCSLSKEHTSIGNILEAKDPGKLNGMEHFKKAFNTANQARKLNPKISSLVLYDPLRSIKSAINQTLSDAVFYGNLRQADAEVLRKEYELDTLNKYETLENVSRMPTWAEASATLINRSIDEALHQVDNHYDLWKVKYWFGDVTNRLTIAKQLVVVGADKPDAWATLGLEHFRNKNFIAAKDAISHAAELDSSFTAYWIMLAAIGRKTDNAELEHRAFTEIKKTWSGSEEAVTKAVNSAYRRFN